VGDNDPFQPQSAGVQDQDKKPPFRRWIIAVVVVLIIASIGGVDLHWTTLHASYSGIFWPYVDPCNSHNYQESSGGEIGLSGIVEDRFHRTFTGSISLTYECGGFGVSYYGTIQDGAVTLIGGVSFTFVLASNGGDGAKFSGSIHSNGVIYGQFSGVLFGNGNFQLGCTDTFNYCNP
jgi:hypothetical protein